MEPRKFEQVIDRVELHLHDLLVSVYGDIRPYAERSTCTKCGCKHDLFPPMSRYDSEHNLLIRKCQRCHFQWAELTADGTSPTL